MPVIKNFGAKLPTLIFQPNVFIQGPSAQLLPWGLILLDTGYSKALAMNQNLREAIGVPSGNNVALKIVLPTPALVANASLTRIDKNGNNPVTTALEVADKDIVCIDQALENRDKWYNVLSVGFARELDRMLLVKHKSLGKISHPHSTEYLNAGGLEVHLPEITMLGSAALPPFHKDLNTEWKDNQPFVKTSFLRSANGPVTLPVLWDTGADLNTLPRNTWAILKGKEAKVLGQDGFILDEMVGQCADNTQLIFREVPFVDADSITVGAPILSAFPELGLGPKFSVLLP